MSKYIVLIAECKGKFRDLEDSIKSLGFKTKPDGFMYAYTAPNGNTEMHFRFKVSIYDEEQLNLLKLIYSDKIVRITKSG